ncbi:MAG: glycosyl hydrolase [Flavobacteriaceae bacterium]|nr:glycosyl hydrolase [Flavobacteriaceae bacterium]
MKYLKLVIVVFLVSLGINAQNLVKNIPFTNIGPTIMSGRVIDIDVNPEKPTEFYVAYASGGLWYTNNNGTSFKPVMDNAPTQNIGDIAVDWKNGTIWVGTGENNSSRSSYAGIGILKSTDKGESWTNVGLSDSHHVSRIILNPKNPNEVVIAVIGHLYTTNAERGIFKTIDGGKTWKHTLFINDATGVIDLSVAQDNFKVMYAAAWQRDRKAWHFEGNGSGSGIYKSTDAGESWKLISNKESGFPTGNGVGRIGLAAFNEDIIYAIHDNQYRRAKEDEKKDDNILRKDDFKSMSVETFMDLDIKKLNNFLKENGFQEKYRAENVKNLVKSGAVKPADLATYLEDANSELFDTPVVGSEIYKSVDGGKTWAKTHDKYLDDIYFSYGYYFGHIYVHPKHQEQIYIYGVPILKSKDGGKTFIPINAENVHVDHHSLWINPNLEGHLINGNDGGVNISFDDGANWIKCNTPAVGQFYAINVDDAKPYNVYGGLQDNGVWMGPSNYKPSVDWHQEGQYPYKSIMGGDGMQVEIDNRDKNTVYTGFQFGNYYRVELKSGKRTPIQPKHDLGETPLRFNWQSPILLSKHNQDILYFGSNKLHRSLNKGEDWTTISADLTQGGKKGNVAFGTLTSISESPFQFGLIYVGSDDGFVHVTDNGGGSWTKISNSLPQNLWVSRVIASSHNKERVYATLNGYRNDDFKPYVYVSDDRGTTWKSISSNLPNFPVNVIREDPVNPKILYLGNDNSVFVSLDSGNSWQEFQKDLPKVAVHDIVIQKDAKELLVGTHGRSIYKASIAPLQQFEKHKNQSVVIFDIDEVRYSKNWGSSWSKWLKPVEPKITIPFYVNKEGNYVVALKSEDGIELNKFEVKADTGYNFTEFVLKYADYGKNAYLKKHKDAEIASAKNGEYYLIKGKYQLVIGDVKQTFEIK